MSQQSGEEKSLPPSDRKLEKAREKGDFAKSPDVVSAFIVISLLLLFAFGAGWFAERFDRLFDFAEAAIRARDSMRAHGWRAVWTAAFEIVAPVVGVSAAATFLGALVANRGFVVAIDPIMPKLDRINPVAGFLRLFSVRNAVEIVKALIKTTLFLGACALIFWWSVQAVIRTPLCDAECAPAMAWLILAPLAAIAAAFFLVSALLDAPLQTWLFRRDQRMTHTELKRERKEQYGDPIVRGQLRRLRRELLQGGGGPGGGRGVSFVIADGAALALRFTYDRLGEGVPILRGVARGASAATVVLETTVADQVVIQDPVLARSLAADGRVGAPPPKRHFDALARVMIRSGILGR